MSKLGQIRLWRPDGLAYFKVKMPSGKFGRLFVHDLLNTRGHPHFDELLAFAKSPNWFDFMNNPLFSMMALVALCKDVPNIDHITPHFDEILKMLNYHKTDKEFILNLIGETNAPDTIKVAMELAGFHIPTREELNKIYEPILNQTGVNRY